MEKDEIGGTACSQVLGTIELLETILLNLPCCKLLPLKRVSQTWNDTLIGSFKLQVAVGHRPLSSVALIASQNGSAQEPTGETSSLETKMVDDNGSVTEWTWVRPAKLEDGEVSAKKFCDIAVVYAQAKKATINPIVYQLLPPREDWGWRGDGFFIELDGLRSLADQIPTAWKKSFLTQPTLAELRVTFGATTFDIDPGFQPPAFASSFSDEQYEGEYALYENKWAEFENKFDGTLSRIGWSYSDFQDGYAVCEKTVRLETTPGVRISDLLNCHRVIQELYEEFNTPWMVEIKLPWQWDSDEYSYEASDEASDLEIGEESDVSSDDESDQDDGH